MRVLELSSEFAYRLPEKSTIVVASLAYKRYLPKKKKRPRALSRRWRIMSLTLEHEFTDSGAWYLEHDFTDAGAS
jgi:hypothetical protein